MSVNKVILVGHVGQDPEVRYIENNTPVCTLRLATSEVYKNKNGERVTTTEWHSVVLWRGLAEVAEKYVKKGAQLYVEGKIRTRAWEDKDKNKRYSTEIVADVMQLLGKKADDHGQQGASAPVSEPADEKQTEPFMPDNGDGLPF
jgi:single-strand DNA-binding protein